VATAGEASGEEMGILRIARRGERTLLGSGLAREPELKSLDKRELLNPLGDFNGAKGASEFSEAWEPRSVNGFVSWLSGDCAWRSLSRADRSTPEAFWASCSMTAA
jgi:hypothetical protein